MNKINVYINSKNRLESETASQFTVQIPQNLLRLQKDEFFMLNVNGFYCYNSWYNCQSFNNKFEIHYYNNNDQLSNIEKYELAYGNPDVMNVKNQLNNLLKNKISVTYDKLTNRFKLKRILPLTQPNQTMYLVIINCEDFLGFSKSSRNKLIELPYLQDVESNYYVNVNGDEAIILKISGDCVLDSNNIDNCGTLQMKPSQVIFMKAIDVPSNGLLTYDNEDAGDSFQCKIANVEQISSFVLTVHNQDDEFIEQFSEYVLNLQFIRHKKSDNMIQILNNILDYIRQIYLLMTQVIFRPYNK